MAEIVLPRRKSPAAVVLVDDADAARLGGGWFINGRYVARRVGGRLELMHRLVLGLAPVDTRQVDHINRRVFDNRRSNLRVATIAQNLQNKSTYRNCKSGHRGICADRQGWRARVRLGGRTVFQKHFASLQDAVAAVKAARARLMPFSEEAIAS